MNLSRSEETLQLVVGDLVSIVGVEPVVHGLLALLEGEKLLLIAKHLSEVVLEKLSVLCNEGADLLVLS